MDEQTPLLVTRDAQDLIESPMPPALWIIEGFIIVGFILLCGSPKVGKSWFALELAICVSTGKPFLDHATAKCEVLYLAMEDTFSRIQQRLFHLVDEIEPTLHFAICAEKIKAGLLDQLEAFLAEHPKTRLIIIDTLQTVRMSNSQNSIYASDYADTGILKSFADKHNIAIVAIHHTRKFSDESNIFNTISGSNGLMGAADTTMVLSKSNYFDGKATLSLTGRDVDMAEFKLSFRDCHWSLIEQTSIEELREREIPGCVLSVIDFMASRAGNWEGTSSALLIEASIEDTSPNALPKYLNEHRDYLEERGVRYARKKTSSARLILLAKIAPQIDFVEH